MPNLQIIAPANTMKDVSPALCDLGEQKLLENGYTPIYSKYSRKTYLHLGGSIEERISDIHTAMQDESVHGLMAVYGGYNSNQLISGLDYQLIAKYPKWFIGYSDITALLLAVHKFSNMPCIHGPGFASFCDPQLFAYTLDAFKSTMNHETVHYQSPQFCASDHWYLKKDFGPRDIYPARGWQVYRAGKSEGQNIGGNLQTLCALAGTIYFPEVKDKILFIEDVDGNNVGLFLRCLTQLSHMNVFNQIRGLIIGAFPHGTQLDHFGLVAKILDMVLPEKADYPVLYNVNCSHIDPMMSIRLGAQTELSTNPPTIVIKQHEIV